MFRTLRSHPFLTICIVSAGVLLAAWLVLRMQVRTHSGNRGSGAAVITVSCAAAVRKPIEELCRRYQARYGTTIRLDYGSSGELESKLRLEAEQGLGKTDLYIPGDDLFAQRAAAAGLTAEQIPAATFRLVFASNPRRPFQGDSLDDILSAGLAYTVCDPTAAVGNALQRALGDRAGEITGRAKVSFPREPEAAAAIVAGEVVDGGFLWDSTASQFGLRIHRLPELSAGTSRISVNVVTRSEQPTQALLLARFLAASEHAQVWRDYHFTPAEPSDAWSERPRLTLVSGGLNREVLAEVLVEFERREGCRIDVQYAGCGTLVAGIKAREETPDLFLTCDRSYLDLVAQRYGEDTVISGTRVVLLVRLGNPKGIHALADLGRPDLRIGLSDPDQSALGSLSWNLLRQFGVEAAITRQGTCAVTVPGAQELVAQMQASEVLDAVMVYEANVQHLRGRYEIIPIDHPQATAIQNVAIAQTSLHPNLARRLIQALQTEGTRKRYRDRGFSIDSGRAP